MVVHVQDIVKNCHTLQTGVIANLSPKILAIITNVILGSLGGNGKGEVFNSEQECLVNGRLPSQILLLDR